MTDSTAHPRSRGEHEKPRRSFAFLLGSSPLARGTQKISLSTRPVTRLIPARAGNTWLGSGEGAMTTAHPRSRGEHGS